GLLVAGLAVRVAKVLRTRPGEEGVLVLPDRMGDVERVAFLLVRRPAQQSELAEARRLVKPRIAVLPDGLELLFRSGADLEAVHGKEHGCILSYQRRKTCGLARGKR